MFQYNEIFILSYGSFFVEKHPCREVIVNYTSVLIRTAYVRQSYSIMEFDTPCSQAYFLMCFTCILFYFYMIYKVRQVLIKQYSTKFYNNLR